MGWTALIWTLVLYGVAAAILWWVWSKVGTRIPEPFHFGIEIVACVVAGFICLGILFSQTPLIPCCVLGGVQLLGGQ